MAALLIIIILLSIKPAIRHYKKRQTRKEEQNIIIARQAAAAAKLKENERKRLEKIEKENQRKKAQTEKRRQQKEQAAADIPFYEIQLSRLYVTANDTRNQYKKACEQLEIDYKFNSVHSSAIKEKVLNQHIENRDKQLKKLMALENQIHALEKKIAAAETILNKG